jgi:hypothetical protein
MAAIFMASYTTPRDTIFVAALISFDVLAKRLPT